MLYRNPLLWMKFQRVSNICTASLQTYARLQLVSPTQSSCLRRRTLPLTRHQRLAHDHTDIIGISITDLIGFLIFSVYVYIVEG